MCDIGSDPSMHDLPVPQCSANTLQERAKPGGWGYERIPCRQTRGLVSFRDLHGRTRYVCSALGHAANVVRRFGVEPAPEPAEPEWLHEAVGR